MAKRTIKTPRRFFKKKTLQDVPRYYPSIASGLTAKQVEERIKQGMINVDANPPTKSIFTIFKDSLFTLFNLLNIGLALILAVVGSYKNMLFMVIVVSNFLIDVVQEIRAKKATDRLSLFSEASVTVIRDKKEQQIKSREIVLDDIIAFVPGDQVMADCKILRGECEVNQSFITGESEPLNLKKGDYMYSGSFISAGSCFAIADAVGEDNISYGITLEAKKIKTRVSDIVKSLRNIIRVISFVIIPLGTIFFLREYSIPGISHVKAIEHTVAAMIGMIPEGLILLTSTVFAVIVVKLAKRKVLVNELYSVEMLARTDVVCFDKTGTLTTGVFEINEVSTLGKTDNEEINLALNMLHQNIEQNFTMQAIGKYLTGIESLKSEAVSTVVPFSGKRKWGAVTLETGQTYILGAPEVVISNIEKDLRNTVLDNMSGHRVLCLSKTKSTIENSRLPQDRTAIALLYLNESIRENAKETIDYFLDKNVKIKLISGDNHITVSGIAKSVGVPDSDRAIDMSLYSEDDDFEDIVEDYVIFGRASPVQKQGLINALKANGHVVTMTGDGVNDVLAMKEADCAISVAQGTDAVKNVADILLLDSSFETVPGIIEEGRMAINNIQRSASLFVVKTIYSALLTLIFIFLNTPYPFSPIQLSLISGVTIGMPAFFLALQPNKERVKGKFIDNVLIKAAPTGGTVVIGIIVIYIMGVVYGLSANETSTLSVLVTGITALLGVLFIALPLDFVRVLLFATMSGLFALGIFGFGNLFEIYPLSQNALITLAVATLICILSFRMLRLIFYKLFYAKKRT